MAPGIKTGGRQKGTPNKRRSTSAVAKSAVVRAVEGGETPLEYMLRIMRKNSIPTKRRDEMARAAAPYVHAKVTDGKSIGTDGGGLTLGELIHLSYQAGKKAKPEDPPK